jgi:hypothetical protein
VLEWVVRGSAVSVQMELERTVLKQCHPAQCADPPDRLASDLPWHWRSHGEQ